MRFLITPNFALAYDRRMVSALAQGLRSIGHEAQAADAPIDDLVLGSVCREYDVDVVLRVNRLRPLERPLPAKVRHVAWYQDIFPETLGDIDKRIRPSDIVYTFGDPQTLGIKGDLPCFTGCLLPGVDKAAIVAGKGEARDQVDFSLCGFIPPPLNLVPNLKRDLQWYACFTAARIVLLGRPFMLRRPWTRILSHYVPYSLSSRLQMVVDTMYQPLRGDLDIHALSQAMNEVAAAFVGRRHVGAKKQAPLPGALGLIVSSYYNVDAARLTAIEAFISYLARDYPRMLDRVDLIGAALDVSESLELYGPGWEAHEAFKPYLKGVLDTTEELGSVFRRSRINLANNTHGIGLHSRTLDCMAVGGFVLTHESPHDTRPGGMLTVFEPGVHYGAFTPDTFREESRRWLRDTPRRRRASLRAAAIVRQKHRWEHRARQIVNDLSR